jgi:hypothetical protein
MLDRTARRAARTAVAALGVAVVALALAACTDGTQDDGGLEVITDLDDSQSAMDLAARVSYGVAEGGIDRVTADGLRLSVAASYFEPLRIAGWTAPDECAFDTEVTLGVSRSGVAARRSTTGPFEGPTSDADAGTSGLLGQVLAVGEPGTAAMSDPSSTPGSGDGEVPDGEVSPTTVVSMGEPPTADSPVAVVVVAFEHAAQVTLRFTEPPADSPFGSLDTQPADGWTPLALMVPAATWAAGALPPVELVVETAEGSTTEAVDIARLGAPDMGEGALGVLTDDWRFDLAAVGTQCEPPIGSGAALNQPRSAESDVFGSNIRPAPTLPQPGEQPADPTDATAQALDAIRAVYDIEHLHDEGKAARTEDPATARRIFDALRANRVIEPYLSNLAPVFGAVTFTSPTEAAIVYRVGPSYQWEIGRVVEIDGEWKLAIGTLCRDLSAAGYSCPGIVIDPPPGPIG